MKVTCKYVSKKELLLLTAIVLGGCGTLAGVATDAIVDQVMPGNDDSSGLSIDTELIVGDKQTTGIETHSTQTNDISGAEVVNLTEGVTFWQAGVLAVVMLILGLFMPQLALRKK